jgi:hypothetical protein
MMMKLAMTARNGTLSLDSLAASRNLPLTFEVAIAIGQETL